MRSCVSTCVLVSSLGRGSFLTTVFPNCLEKEMATHSGTLAWKIPWTEEPDRLQSTGSQSQTRLSDFTSLLQRKPTGLRAHLRLWKQNPAKQLPWGTRSRLGPSCGSSRASSSHPRQLTLNEQSWPYRNKITDKTEETSWRSGLRAVVAEGPGFHPQWGS